MNTKDKAFVGPYVTYLVLQAVTILIAFFWGLNTGMGRVILDNDLSFDMATVDSYLFSASVWRIVLILFLVVQAVVGWVFATMWTERPKYMSKEDVV